MTLDGANRARITGTVVEARSGAPLAGASCFATQSQGTVARPVRASDDGRFALDVPSGSSRVECALVDERATPLRAVIVELESGGTAHVDVPLVLGRELPRFTPPIVIPDDRGARVLDPTQLAGLRAGDLILRIDGLSVAGASSAGAVSLLLDRPAGTFAVLEIERDGRVLTVEMVGK